MKSSLSGSHQLQSESDAPPDHQYVQSFITDISSSRQAFQLFKETASKEGLELLATKSESRYGSTRHKRERQTYQSSRNVGKGKSQSYVPLKDLLTKNIDDRVQDYLQRMEGMTVDEIIRGTNLTTRKLKISEEKPMVTHKQMKILTDLR